MSKWVLTGLALALTLQVAPQGQSFLSENPPAPLPDPFAQNDAGLGADAPNLMEQAWALAPGVFQGTLRPSPTAGIADELAPTLDREDWYRFHIKAGSRVEMKLQLLNPPAGLAIKDVTGAVMELRNPSGQIAAWAVVPRASDTEDRSFAVTDQRGWWTVRIQAMTPRVEVAYAFDLEVERSRNHHVEVATNGYAVLGYEIGPNGGTLAGDMGFVGVGEGPSPIHFGFRVLEGPDLNFITGFGNTLSRIAPPYVNLHALDDDHAEEASLFTDDFSMFRASWEKNLLRITTPGTYYFIADGVAARGSYLFIDVEASGDTRFLGALRRGPEGQVAIRFHEFEGVLGAQATEYHVGIKLHAEATLEHYVSLGFWCGRLVMQCTATDPKGQVYPTPIGGWAWDEDNPGLWKFDMDLAVDDTPELYAVYGIDLELPSPGKHHR